MARNIDIAISAKDNMSDALRKMQSNLTPFRKDLGELEKELDRLSNNKVTLKTDLTKASTELKNAKKDFANLGDEMSRQKLMAAQMNYDNIKRNLDLVSSGARQTEKDMKNLTTQMSKTDNRAVSMQTGKAGGVGGTLSGLGKAGLYNLVGQSVANAGQTYIASAFGSVTGNAVNSVLSGMASGAAIGTMMGGPLGTVIGGAVGTVAGVVNAATEKYKNEDEAFKGVVKSEYERLKELEKADLEAGTSIAGNREMVQVSFETQLGSRAAAKNILGQVHSYASKTPYEYDTVANTAKQLITFGTSQDDVMGRVGQLGDMAQGRADILDRITLAYGKMTAKQKVSLEELNMMTEAGIPILKQLTKQYGVTEEQMFKMISGGKLGINDINDAMDALTGKGGAFYNMSEKMSRTYSGLKSTKESLESDLQAAMGEGYNKKRMEGLQAEIKFLDSEAGQRMKDGYKRMGEWQAELENGRAEILQKHMTELFDTTEYKAAVQNGDGAKIGKMIAATRAKAEAAYKEGPGYQLQQQTDMNLVENLRSTMKGSWYNYGYEMQLEFEKGRASVPAAGRPNYGPGNLPTNNPQSDTLPDPDLIISPKVTTDNGVTKFQGFGVIGGDAYGLPYVPYDNYAALLHQGERVLTAAEARAYREGGAGITLTGNNFTVREEADIYKIAQALFEELRRAQMVS